MPRAAKTSLARSMSGGLKVPSSILKSSFCEGLAALPEAASLLALLGFLGVSAGLFTVLGCTGSFSGLLATSCLGSEGAAGLVRPAGPGAAGLFPALAASAAAALGLSTACPGRTLDDKLLVAGAELGVSLRSTRGATLGVEEGGGDDAEAAAAPLAGVAWPEPAALASGAAAAGGAMLEVSVVVSLVGLFWAVAKVSVIVSELVVPVVTEGSMSSTVAAVSAGCLRGGHGDKRERERGERERERDNEGLKRQQGEGAERESEDSTHA